jgi:hypothetical protein
LDKPIKNQTAALYVLRFFYDVGCRMIDAGATYQSYRSRITIGMGLLNSLNWLLECKPNK